MTLDEAQTVAADLADKLGKSLDKGIKNTLMALWMNGFNTIGSCEGHLRRGMAVPWVDFYLPLTPQHLRAHRKVEKLRDVASEKQIGSDWDAYHRAAARLHRMWLPDLSRLSMLMLDFNAERPKGRQNLVLNPLGYAGARLVPQSHIFLPQNSLEERKAILYGGRQEMRDFTEFLWKQAPDNHENRSGDLSRFHTWLVAPDFG
jgi:hypothetical protein